MLQNKIQKLSLIVSFTTKGYVLDTLKKRNSTKEGRISILTLKKEV